MKVKFNLSKLQAKHKNAIKWLFSACPRAEGRSTLLAIVYIELAIEEGREIRIRDHFGYADADRHLMGHVKMILQESGLLSQYQWRFGETFIHCIHKSIPRESLIKKV